MIKVQVGSTQYLGVAMSNIKVGDEVMLDKNSPRNNGHHKNPLNKLGVVTRVTIQGEVEVHWRMNMCNSYDARDLVLQPK
jgi:hypothetical protein